MASKNEAGPVTRQCCHRLHQCAAYRAHTLKILTTFAIPDDKPHAKLLVIGDGEMLPAIQTESAKHPVSPVALLITDGYPPDRSGRAEKMQRRVYYLTQFGWDVILLAPKTPQDDRPYRQFSLHDRQVTIIRTHFFFAKRWPSLKHNKDRKLEIAGQNLAARLMDLIFVPKGYIRWFPFAIRKALSLRREVDVVLTVNNPITHHLLGLTFKLLTGKPWVAEFRDAIVAYRYSQRGPEFINRFVERLLVSRANRIIELGDATAVSAASRYPKLPQERFVYIPVIGYDPAVFADYQSLPGPDCKGPFSISYTGSFYGTDIVPTYILKGLARAVEEHHLTPEQIQLTFAGDWAKEYDQLIEDLKIGPFVQSLGRIPFQACVALWAKSDAVLMLLGADPATLHLVPTKLADYVASRRHILTLAPSASRVASIVREKELGSIVEPTDVQQIAKTLAGLVQQKARGMTFINTNEDVVNAMSCLPGERQVAETLAAAVNDKS